LLAADSVGDCQTNPLAKSNNHDDVGESYILRLFDVGVYQCVWLERKLIEIGIEVKIHREADGAVDRHQRWRRRPASEMASSTGIRNDSPVLAPFGLCRTSVVSGGDFGGPVSVSKNLADARVR
jgi:hypothetical protein